MPQNVLSIPPRTYYTSNDESITVRQLRGRSPYSFEWKEVRKRISIEAFFIPHAMQVASDPSMSVIFLAVGNAQPVGNAFLGFVVVNTLYISSGVVAVSWISVLNHFRGQHIGRSLLCYVECFCRGNNVERIEVMDTSGYTKLFKRYGFRKTCSPLIFRHKALQKIVLVNSLPAVPQCISNGGVTVRYAVESDRRGWTLCLLEACSYIAGCADLVKNAFCCDFRVSVVDNSKNRVVAMVSMDTSGWIPLIACLEEYRGQGLGSFLMFMAMEWLRLRGGDSVTLTPLNERVLHFYKRWAFRVDKSSRAKRKRGADNGVVLTRKLLPMESYLPEGYVLEDFIKAVTPQNDRHCDIDDNG
ncbi:putative Acetyltransferase (GNAT) family [Trypanosoma vivax]|uniref:N-acetyltransferase domain-containing protein n=1 Tax=Trypanosoma vivax (strain Y486) TaxID=1055687 RepID=G0TV23_TRYVY|nr:hypothetical protein TRVL_04511 [Trypanosoma vivax]KAH8618761.1 putative Acetyltransferase (GNAT) family [Trypanosoma vivax]CCC48206.1 conserved hypothetical protein [Trypanosoma vivax Y486]